MPIKRPAFLAGLILCATLVLSGCESAEEKAEGYYKSGMEFLEAGDEERALVEFRNVFKHNGFHQEARRTYADVMVKRGNLREAYSQYLRLIEQYPDLVDIRMTLAEMAMAQGDWDEVERHGLAAAQLDPESPRIKAIVIAIDYRAAAKARDTARLAELAADAEGLLVTLPDSLVLRRVLIDKKMSDPDALAALPQVEAAIALDPRNIEFHALKLRLLGRTGDMDAVGVQLKSMVALFPDDEELKKTLVNWSIKQGDFAGAEAFLRAEAGAMTGDSKKHITVVQLLILAKGRDAGRAELAQLIAANAGTPNADFYGAFLASMDFEDGKSEEAIASLEKIVAAAGASDQTRGIQAILARMLDATQQRDRAKALIADVLEADPSNVDGLKLRATWAIAEDRPGDAIQDLRTAQGQAPRDAQIMSLLAAAFERDGNLDLAGEQLAKAVETSGAAAEESLRYVQFLRNQGRVEVAEGVLTEARRVAPSNPAVLVTLAEVFLEQQKWPQVQEIVVQLREIASTETLQAANQIEAAILLGKDQIEEGLTLLEEQAASSGDIRPTLLVAMTQIRSGKIAEARRFIEAALVKTPQEPALRLLAANIEAISGNADGAETIYRELIADEPMAEVPVRMLYGLLISLGREDDANAALEAALSVQPEAGTLLWIKAGLLERAGDFDGAIAIYERLYSQNSGNIVVANNLASMLTTHRDDAENLERAFAIARRFRDSDVPAFQDTYGWIEYRRGNLEEALRYLEPAAAGLPDDPLVQFHLAMSYADLGRKDEAIARFEQAIKAGEGRDLPQLALAQQRLEELAVAP